MYFATVVESVPSKRTPFKKTGCGTRKVYGARLGGAEGWSTRPWSRKGKSCKLTVAFTK